VPGRQFGGQLEHRGTLRVGVQLLGSAPRISKTPAITSRQLCHADLVKGRLVQYAERILRPHPGQSHTEIHDYHDTASGVRAESMVKRAAGYTSLGFPTPATSLRHPVRAQPKEITDSLA